jgi:hypothetical protein
MAAGTAGQTASCWAPRSGTGATARTYLDDEIIKDMARRMLFEVASERPGADLMEAPRTVPLSLALVGITVAALAEAMQVRAANEPPDHLRDVMILVATSTLSRSERSPTVTQRSSARCRHWPFRCIKPRCRCSRWCGPAGGS